MGALAQLANMYNDIIFKYFSTYSIHVQVHVHVYVHANVVMCVHVHVQYMYNERH